MLGIRFYNILIARALESLQVIILGETAERLCESHPDAIEDLQRRRSELNKAWNDLKVLTEDRKENLNEAQKFYSFLSKAR